MRKALIVIDYQNDFVADDGKLTCGILAQGIEDNICKLIDNTFATGGEVIFTMDTHDDFYNDTKESKKFPPHCNINTAGWERYGKVASKNGTLYRKNTFALGADIIEDILGNYDEICLCGVATNICVLQNAIAFYNISEAYGYDVKFKIAELACASFDSEAHYQAMDYMRNVLGFEDA